MAKWLPTNWMTRFFTSRLRSHSSWSRRRTGPWLWLKGNNKTWKLLPLVLKCNRQTKTFCRSWLMISSILREAGGSTDHIWARLIWARADAMRYVSQFSLAKEQHRVCLSPARSTCSMTWSYLSSSSRSHDPIVNQTYQTQENRPLNQR